MFHRRFTFLASGRAGGGRVNQDCVEASAFCIKVCVPVSASVKISL